MDIEDWLTVVTVLGLVGMGLLVSAAFAGVVMAAHAVKRFPFMKGRVFFWHQWGTTVVGLLILLHSISSLTTSARTEITWQNIFVPFTATKESLWLGIGVIALYLLIFNIATSLAIRKKHKKLWRSLHYSTYAALVLGLVHGLFISSTFQSEWELDYLDAEKVTVEIFGVLLIAAVAYRIRLASHSSRPTTARREAPRQLES